MMMPAAEEPSSSPLSVSRCSSTSAPPVDVFMASDGNMALMQASTTNNSNNFLTHLNARRWSCCGSGLDTTPPRDARLHRHRHETSPLTRFFANQSPSRGPREISSGRAASCASTIAPHRRDTLAFMHDVVADAHHHPHTNDDDVSQEVMMDMVQYGNFLDQPLMRATDDLLLLRLSPVPHMNLASDADEMETCAAQRDDVAAASSSSSCGTHMKMMKMKMNESSSIIPACREEVCTPVENLLRSAGQSTYLGSTEQQQQQQQNRSHTPRLFLSSRPTTPRKRRGRLSATGSLYSQQQQQQRSASRTSPRAVVDVAADYLAPNRNPCSPYRGDDHGCVSLDLSDTHGHQHKDVVRVVDELIANTLAPAPLRHDAAVAFYAQVVPQSASLAHLQPREAQLSSCQQQQQQQPHAASISSAASWMEEFLHPSSEVSSAISETDVTRRTSRQQPHQHLPPRIQLHTPKLLPESVSPPQRRCSSNASAGSTGRDVFPLLPPPTSYTSSITQRSVWPHHHESSEGASPPSPQLTTATPRSSSVPHVHRAMVPASSQQLLLHSPHNHPQHQHQQHAHTHFPMLDASTSSHLLRSLGVLPRGMETVKSEDDGGAHSSTNMDDDDGVEDDDDEDGAGARFRRCGRFQYLHHLPDGARCVPIHVDVNGVVWLVHNRLDGLPYAVKEVREDDVNPAEVVCLSMSSNPCVSPYHHQAETCVARFHHCVCVGRDGRGAVGMHNSAVRLIQTEFFPRGTVWENVLDPFGKRTSSSSSSSSPNELCFADLSTCAWRRILVHALMGLASLHGSSLVHGCPLLFNLFYADDAHVKWANFGSSVMHPHHHHHQQQQHVQRWLSVEMMKRIQTEEVSPYDTEVAMFCCGVFMLMLACDMRARGDLSRDDLLQQNPWEWLRVCRKEMQQYFFMMENEVPTTASSSSSSSMKKMIAGLHPDRQQLWEVIRVGATQPRSAALLLQLLHPPSMEMFSTTLMLDREIQRLLQLVAANTHATTTTTSSSSPEDNIARTRMMPMNAESSSAAASVSEHSGGGGGCCCLDHVRTSSTCAQRLAIFPRARGMAEQRLRATSSREPQWLILQVQAIIFHVFDDDDDHVGASTTTVASSCTFRPPSWADVRPLCCRETLPQQQHSR